jgi:hypothetical protein
MAKTLIGVRLSAKSLFHLRELAKGAGNKTAAIEKALAIAFAIHKAEELSLHTKKEPVIQQGIVKSESNSMPASLLLQENLGKNSEAL